MPSPVIQFKRGLSSGITSFRAGEPAFTTDTFDFYIGLDNTLTNNKFFGSHRYWTKETASKGSGVNLVESTSGTDFITLAAPASVGAAVTYYFPATQGASSSVLTNDGSGNLSWASGSNNATFTGITTFSDTTDNTLGNADTGAVQIDGGLGINKNTTIGQSLYVNQDAYVTGLSTFNGQATFSNLSVFNGTASFYDVITPSPGSAGNNGIQWGSNIWGGSGDVAYIKYYQESGENTRLEIACLNDSDDDIYLNTNVVNVSNQLNVGGATSVTGNTTVGGNLLVVGESEFVGVVTFRGGTINLGDSNTDNLVLTADVNSDIIPNTTSTFNLGSSSQRWGAIYGTSSNISGISTLGGALISGYTSIEDLRITGITTISGIIDGTSTLEIDGHVTFNGGMTAQGISTFNSPIDNNSDLSVDGITTLNGNLVSAGFSTFQNGVTMNSSLAVSGNTTLSGALGVTGIATFSNNVKVNGSADIVGNLRVSGITTIGDASSDTLTVNATTTFVEPVVGTIGTATRAKNVDVAGVAVNQDYYITLVDGSGNSKAVGVDAELLYNPNTNKMKVPTINVGTLNAADGASAITLTSSTGDVGISSSLTVNGNLYVLGSTTQVETTSLKVQDTLIDLGLVQSGGVLVPPASDLNLDIGVLFNWYDGSAKKASVYWDDSVQRIAIASSVSETNGVLTANNWADVEIGSLWVNDCAGESQVIYCASSERFLQNITVDAGTF
jgi:hypothetical protein